MPLASLERLLQRLTGAVIPPLVRRLRAPLNRALIRALRRQVFPRSVLHVSFMVHVPYYTVRLLRAQGYRADYLAIGRSATWDRADYCYEPARWPGLVALKEWWWFWSLMARYELVHLHFMTTLSYEGWELAVLRALGRRIVVHFRGCEARDRTLNMRLHPAMNICQSCDYDPYACERPVNVIRRELARRYADLTLVTTPDLLDFIPDAIWLPLFAPDESVRPVSSGPRWPDRAFVRIVHVTNHPGIEGTAEIEQAIERLQRRGYKIEFVGFKGVRYEQVLDAYAQADLAIGKMKMGFYANGQIESLWCGVPTITYVRREFRTPELEVSGLILATLDTLDEVIAAYIDHPDRLAAKRKIARESVLRLHEPTAVARRLIELYQDCVRNIRCAGSGSR